MGEFGLKEILLVLLIILILFGAKRIPEMMKAMGQGVKEFKKAAKDIQSDDESPPAPKTPAAPAKDDSQKPA
jgi:sec-independent protein translocase protein TatA